MKVMTIKVFGMNRIVWYDPESDKPVHVATDDRGRSVWIVKGELVRREKSSW